MSVSWEKVRLVGQFEIFAQDNLFSSKVRLVGQFFLRPCLVRKSDSYESFLMKLNEKKREKSGKKFFLNITKVWFKTVTSVQLI